MRNIFYKHVKKREKKDKKDGKKPYSAKKKREQRQAEIADKLATEGDKR